MAYKNKQKEAAYHAGWYLENKRSVLETNKRSVKLLRCEIAWYKIKHGCTDCRQQLPPECYEFDHVRGNKEGNVSSLVSSGRRKAAYREIAKCEVVCANCHRIRMHRL